MMNKVLPELAAHRHLLTSYRINKKPLLQCSHNLSNVASTADDESHSSELPELNATDPFASEFSKRQIKLTSFQKTLLGFGSSIAALIDPRRHDMIACLGETTGESTLQNIYDQMEQCNEGKQILLDKPRINTSTVNLNELRKLSPNTFGRTYVKFLDDNQVTPDSRTEVRFMDDAKLAYVMTRYRECHDLIHTVLGMPTNMLGEVSVKWVEALNIGLPMCYGGAVFGAARLKPKQRKNYLATYLPWAISNGKRIKPLMNVYWEKRWEQDVDQLRDELHIKVLKMK